VSRKQISTELFCLRCEKKSPHIVEYRNDLIVHICCGDCGKMIGPHAEIIASGLPNRQQYKATVSPAELKNYEDKHIHVTPLQSYRENLICRIVTKPSRLTQEMHHDINAFLRSIPVRVITKPIRMAKEISQISRK
jgi:hypothetical protein